MKEGAKKNRSAGTISFREISLFLFLTLIMLGLHVWGTAAPSHLNWGTHVFAFYPAGVTVVVLLLVLLVAVSDVQKILLSYLEQLFRKISKIPVAVTALLSAGCMVAGAFLFQVKMHLLGDGAVLLRSNALAAWGDDLNKSFSNQPLMRLIYRSLLTVHGSGVVPSPHEIYLWIDIGAGILFIFILFWFFRKLENPVLECFLAGTFLLTSGSTQFFFGYVENYVLQFVIGILFLLSGWLALRGRSHLIVPVICYGIITALHLGFLILAPAVLFLVYWNYRKEKIKMAAAAAVLLAAGIGFMVLVGFNVRGFLRHITAGSVDFLQPLTAIGGNFPYPMFSFWHAWDWFNAGALVAPMGLVIAIPALIVLRKHIDWKDPVLIFLLLAAGCGLLFTWIINFALGMARDWDLFSTFLAPLLVLDVYLLTIPGQVAVRRYILLVAVVLSAFHWGAWIGINASHDKHLARMKLLNNPHLLSPVSQMVYDEALANYYFDGGDFADARIYYEHFMTIDNHNPRIVGNIADTYRKLGLTDKYFAMLQHAIDIHTPDPGVYSNIGVEYANRGDTARAIAYNELAVRMDSTQRLAHANLGILYATKRDFYRAERHFAKAIELGMHEAPLFRYAGDVDAFLGNYPRALEYYNAYLNLVPGDERVRSTRNQILTIMKNTQK